MSRIYLESSFVSACVTDRRDAASIYRRDTSREWWRLHAHLHELAVSAEVTAELSAPTFHRRVEALAWIAGVPSLDVDEEVVGIAEILVREKVMPGPVAGDAVHIAVAAAHGMDYVLSWNVRHLANPNKLDHLRVVCRRLGIVPPSILTPDMLWSAT